MLITFALILPLAGCTSTYHDRMERSGHQVVDLRSRLDAAEAEIARLEEKQNGRGDGDDKQQGKLTAQTEVAEILKQRVANLKQENDKLHAELASTVMTAAGGKTAPSVLGDAGGVAVAEARLPKKVADSLAALAQRQRGARFDPARRVLRCEGDLLFGAVGDRLQPPAIGLLGELAAILNGPEAKSLNFIVAARASSKSRVLGDLAAQYPTDWHLAAHQAIAIEQLLEEKGIAPHRVGITVEQTLGGKDGRRGLFNTVDAHPARIEIYLEPSDAPAD